MQPFENWIQLLGLCINLPMSEPQCRPLWEGVVYVSAGLALLITAWLVWKWQSGNGRPGPATKPDQAKRQTAAGSEQKKYDDRDPEKLMEDVTDPHLREKIRRELEQRRLQNMRAR